MLPGLLLPQRVVRDTQHYAIEKGDTLAQFFTRFQVYNETREADTLDHMHSPPTHIWDLGSGLPGWRVWLLGREPGSTTSPCHESGTAKKLLWLKSCILSSASSSPRAQHHLYAKNTCCLKDYEGLSTSQKQVCAGRLSTAGAC